MTLIKLRKKPAAKNTVRLYLDAYPPIYDPVTGKSQRKFYLRLFEGIKYDDIIKFLKPWLKNAGINKYFTFHGFRHTFATLQLASGTSIYTISKLLGHRNLKTTEIYAKIIDSVAREASLKIKLDFD